MQVASVIQIPPKSRSISYRKHKILVTYIPDTGEWEWTVTHVRTLEFKRTTSTFQKAVNEAKERIDQLLE